MVKKIYMSINKSGKNLTFLQYVIYNEFRVVYSSICTRAYDEHVLKCSFLFVFVTDTWKKAGLDVK